MNDKEKEVEYDAEKAFDIAVYHLYDRIMCRTTYCPWTHDCPHTTMEACKAHIKKSIISETLKGNEYDS